MQFKPGLTHPIQVRHHDDAILHRDPEQRDEADTRGDVDVLTGQVQGDQAAQGGQRHDTQDEQRLTE